MKEFPTIVIFEDLEFYKDEIGLRIREVIKGAVIKIAGDIVAAKEMIASEVEIDIATVDGNLYEEDKSGDDGRELEGMLRKKFPNIRIIEISGRGKDLESPDFRLTKMSLISTEAFPIYLKSIARS
jgi:hypothetical protein